MIYVGHLAKKTGVFQKAYSIRENDIYITDTKRAKMRFLKSNIQNIVFGEEFVDDGVMGGRLTLCSDYDKDFVVGYLPHMIRAVTDFLHLTLPLEEIAVFSDRSDIRDISLNFAKLVSVVGQGEDRTKDGVQIRYIRKIRTMPALIITEGGSVSPVFRVPCINLGTSSRLSSLEMHWQSSCFKTDAFPFEIGMDALMFFIQRGEKMRYEPVSFRKKAPPLYTFC